MKLARYHVQWQVGIDKLQPSGSAIIVLVNILEKRQHDNNMHILNFIFLIISLSLQFYFNFLEEDSWKPVPWKTVLEIQK
jgi:hypothetical protein